MGGDPGLIHWRGNAFPSQRTPAAQNGLSRLPTFARVHCCLLICMYVDLTLVILELTKPLHDCWHEGLRRSNISTALLHKIIIAVDSGGRYPLNEVSHKVSGQS